MIAFEVGEGGAYALFCAGDGSSNVYPRRFRLLAEFLPGVALKMPASELLLVSTLPERRLCIITPRTIVYWYVILL